MSTKDFKTRNEILVEIGEGETGDDDGAAMTRKPGAIVKPRKSPRSFLPRRIGGGDLFFYDPGTTKSGSNYFDVAYQIIHDWTNLGGSGIPFPSPITDADFAARDAFILANLSNAGQITPDYTDRIGIYAVFDDDEIFLTTGENEDIWTNAGLKVTAAQFAAENISVGYFNLDFGETLINLQGDDANKITETFDYAAPGYDFKLRIKDKIYFVPAINKSLAEENFPGYLGFFSFVQQLNFFWLFFPRNPWIASAEIDARALPNNRVMRSTQSTFGGTWANTALSGSDFITVVTNGIFRTDPNPDGSLVAVVVRGDQTFYVWKGAA